MRNRVFVTFVLHICLDVKSVLYWEFYMVWAHRMYCRDCCRIHCHVVDNPTQYEKSR